MIENKYTLSKNPKELLPQILKRRADEVDRQAKALTARQMALEIIYFYFVKSSRLVVFEGQQCWLDIVGSRLP